MSVIDAKYAMRTVMADSVQGEGTKEKPYLIGTEEDLKAYRDYVNNGGAAAYARLTADITVTENNWEVIGTLRQPFFGEFDGNGKSVTLDVWRNLAGLYDIELTKDVTGLFGFNCGTIRNLTVKGSVYGGQRVGAIAGVNGDYYPVGTRGYSGARAYQGVIENCVNQAEVKGTGCVGGIVGMNVGGMDNHLYENRSDARSQITGCRNEGIVGLTGSRELKREMIGGIAGYSAAGNITDCQNTADISGERIVGGIVGKVGGDASQEETYLQVIQNCENTGNVKYTEEQSIHGRTGLGAIAGAIQDDERPQEINIENIFVNCNYLMDKENNYNLPGVGDKEVKQYDGAITYDVPAEPEEFKNGAGTEEDPYLIENLNNFLYFAQNHEKGIYYKLVADINLKGNEKNPWTPVGSGEKSFEGIFDGDGHTIRGLYVKKPMKGEEKNSQGLFAKNGGTIKNLTVEGTVWGHTGIGGIAGNNTGTITSCTNKVNVNGGESVGGIAGANKGWIEKSENHGNITGLNQNDFGESFSLSVKLEGGIGGIAGGNYTNVVNNKEVGGQITGCINRGEIKRPGDYNNVNGNEIVGVGGIVGQQNAYRVDSLKSCANYGAVSGPGATGGIAGKSQGPVADCTNNGSVTQIKGATVLVGGVVGRIDG